MEYIWKGDYNSVDDNLVFEGEYENGLRKNGVEYYLIGNKKYEGDYKDRKRQNRIIYDINMN